MIKDQARNNCFTSRLCVAQVMKQNNAWQAPVAVLAEKLPSTPGHPQLGWRLRSAQAAWRRAAVRVGMSGEAAGDLPHGPGA